MKRIIKNLLLFCYVFFIFFESKALDTPDYRLSVSEIQSTLILLESQNFDELDRQIPNIVSHMSVDDFGILLEKASEKESILNAPSTLKYILTKYAPINLAEEIPININKYIYLMRSSQNPVNSVLQNLDEYENILINIFTSDSEKTYKLQPDISYPKMVIPRHSSDIEKIEKYSERPFNYTKLLDKWKFKNIFLNTLANISFLHKNSRIFEILKRESSTFIGAKRIIWHAIHRKCPIEKIKYFLDRFANPNGYKYEPPLLAAAEQDNEKILKLLIKNGANVDGYKDACPLYAATINNNARTAEFLINNEANVNGYKYACPLFIATSNGALKIMSILIAHDAEINGYQYPLYVAVRNNQAQAIKLLLEAHADINGFKEHNPLCFAVENNFFGSAVLLLKNNANPNGYLLHNPLYIATAHKKYNMMEILLRYNADPNGYKENAPLYIAAQNNDPKAIKILLKSSSIQINGYSPIINPLLAATRNNSLKIIKLLLEHKANPNGYISSSFALLITPVKLAIKYNFHEALDILLKFGAFLEEESKI